MKREKSCGAIIYKKINNILNYLIVKSVDGYWSFSKGHVEANESEKETAIREVKEETNIDIKIIDDIKFEDEYYIPQIDAIKKVTYFLSEYQNDEIILQAVEISDYRLCPIEDALNLIERKSTANVLIKANDYIIEHNL